MAFCFVGMFANLTYSQSVTNWGIPVYDIQLATTLSNNVITPDSIIVLECHVKNTSTNNAYFLGDPRLQFQISLVSDTKENYELTTDPLSRPGGGGIYELKPSETNDYAIPLQINKDLKHGNYKLETTISMRTIIEANTIKIFRVVSSPLDIEIK
jgi:hypothetical protein